MSEEEIRGKLLLPYLNELGFSASEITLEHSFSVRLGKNRHALGRSDIICKRDGQNLFVIELKKDSLLIDEEAISQGISYARMLPENIAPFVIITNGNETKIFDSISKKELSVTGFSKDSEFWKNNCTLSTDVDLRIRFEALKNFISFSTDNLKVFCETHVRDRMGPIVGDIKKPHAKFVKELFVQRNQLQEGFTAFMNSDNHVFGIVGAAGVGKTSAMCSLALQRLDHEIVFFYNAALINKSPQALIAQDLNVTFSSHSDSDGVLKRLNELGSFLKKTIMIFIDAVDENVDSNLPFELSEMALTIRGFSNVKMCVSCKSNVWSNLLKRSGTPTHLYEELEKSHDKISSLDNLPGLLLSDFTDEELKNLIPLYKRVFDFKGEISTTLLKELRNGFFLRIFSEVYSGKEIPESIDDKNLVSRYLKQSFEMMSVKPEIGLRILAKIGEILIGHRYDWFQVQREDGMEIGTLMERMNFALDEFIPEELFSRNLLVRTGKDDSYHVSFYYSKIRDYVICFHSFKLDVINDKEFYNSLDKFYENHIGYSAIDFFIENAKEGQKQVIRQFKRDKALSYLNEYNSFLEKNFKLIKQHFDPKTSAEIGIFIPLDLINGDAYALASIDSAAKRIQNLPPGNPMSDFFDVNFFFKNGINTLHGSLRPLLVANQSEAVRREIFKQLEEIVTKGQINIYSCDILMLEQVSLILYFYWKKLNYSYQIKDYYLPRFNQIYPINLSELEDKIYRFRAEEHFRRISVDRSSVSELVEEAMRKKTEIPPLNITGDFPPIEELSKLVTILLAKGYDQIQNHHLPFPDISTEDAQRHQDSDRSHQISRARIFQFSEHQGRLYAMGFLKHLESCYKEFVESCFPTIKDSFRFYRSMPHEFTVYVKDNDIHTWGWFGHRTSKSGEVKVDFKEYRSNEILMERREMDVLYPFTLERFLHISFPNVVQTIPRMNTKSVDENCVLRSWIYEILKSDMREMFEANRD